MTRLPPKEALPLNTLWTNALALACVAALTLGGCGKKDEAPEAPAQAPAANPATPEKPTAATPEKAPEEAPEAPAEAAPAPEAAADPAAAPQKAAEPEKPAPAAIDCEKVCTKSFECAKLAMPGATASDQARKACVMGCGSANRTGQAAALKNFRFMETCAEEKCGPDYHRCLAKQARGEAPK